MRRQVAVTRGLRAMCVLHLETWGPLEAFCATRHMACAGFPQAERVAVRASHAMAASMRLVTKESATELSRSTVLTRAVADSALNRTIAQLKEGLLSADCRGDSSETRERDWEERRR